MLKTKSVLGDTIYVDVRELPSYPPDLVAVHFISLMNPKETRAREKWVIVRSKDRILKRSQRVMVMEHLGEGLYAVDNHALFSVSTP